jgi:phosphonate transport system permease protein
MIPPQKKSKRQFPFSGALSILATMALIVWSFRGVAFDLNGILVGIPRAWSYVRQMIPQSRADFLSIKEFCVGNKQTGTESIWQPLSETIQMAVVGTVLGAIPAFPLSFFAARTTSFFRPIAVLFKTLLNIGRAVPILVYAMIIITGLGLGDQTGAVAIGVGTFVMLCKLYAEALESVAPGPVEAVKAAGGNGIQVFVFAMVPQVFPSYLSSTLYALELNLQASFILGIVGAGGIGFELQNALRIYDMLQAGVLVVLLIILVNLVDYLSYRVRIVFS